MIASSCVIRLLPSDRTFTAQRARGMGRSARHGRVERREKRGCGGRARRPCARPFRPPAAC
eukprot:2755068-Prymnesium_polylepis.1